MRERRLNTISVRDPKSGTANACVLMKVTVFFFAEGGVLISQ